MDVVHEFLDDIIDILNRPVSLSGKIRLIMERELEIETSNPDLFLFFYSEIRNSTESFLKEISLMKDKLLEKWSEQINENVKKKIIRKIDPISAFSLIIGHMQFPFLASTLLKELGEFNGKTYNKFLNEQKEYAVEMVTKFLFLKKE